MNPTLQQQALQALDNALETAERALQRTIQRPSLRFNQRGKIAGSARLQQYEIRLNPHLLADHPDYFFRQVIPHELCHLLVFARYGRVKPHGPEWQQMMRDVFKLPPDVTHKLSTENLPGKEFAYLCGCGPVMLSIRRHNKVVRGQQQYLCRACGEQLQPAPSPT